MRYLQGFLGAAALLLLVLVVLTVATYVRQFEVVKAISLEVLCKDAEMQQKLGVQCNGAPR